MRRCPECNSPHTRRSRRRYPRSSPLQLFTVWVRCRECRARFPGTDWLRLRRWAVRGAALAATLLVVYWAATGGGGQPTGVPGAQRPAVLLPEAETPAPEEARASISRTVLVETAEAGDPAAQYHLGLTLFQEYQANGDRDLLAEGIHWLRSAADAGDPSAQLELGMMCEEGRGVIEDYAEAARWYRSAALQGEARAMLLLGRLVDVGRGVEADPVAAYVWLNLAAARGETLAEMTRDRVRAKLSDEEVTEAQRRSRRLDQELPHR